MTSQAMHIYVTLRAQGEAHVVGLSAEGRSVDTWRHHHGDEWKSLLGAIIRACGGRRGLIIHLPRSQASADLDMRMRDAQWLEVVGVLQRTGSRLEWLP